MLSLGSRLAPPVRRASHAQTQRQAPRRHRVRQVSTQLAVRRTALNVLLDTIARALYWLLSSLVRPAHTRLVGVCRAVSARQANIARIQSTAFASLSCRQNS